MDRRLKQKKKGGMSRGFWNTADHLYIFDGDASDQLGSLDLTLAGSSPTDYEFGEFARLGSVGYYGLSSYGTSDIRSSGSITLGSDATVAWISRHDNNQPLHEYECVWSLDDNMNGSGVIVFRLENTTYDEFGIWVGGSYHVWQYQPIHTGEFHLWALTLSGNTVRVYLDGVVSPVTGGASDTYRWLGAGRESARLRLSHHPSNPLYQGLADFGALAIWENDCLDATEIQSLDSRWLAAV